MFHWIKRENEKNREKEKLQIFVATDLHYLSRSLTDYGSLFWTMVRHSDGKVTEYEEELLDAFVEQVKKERPDVLVLTGDLTFDGAKLSHQGLWKKLERLCKIGIKIYVFPGNHDICKKSEAYRFVGEKMIPEEGLTREEFSSFYEKFGYGEAISKDRNSLSYIAQPTKGVWLIFLDVNGSSQYNELTRESLIWLERQLRKARRKGIDCFSFSHQNILIHNEMASSGFLIENYQEIQKILEKYGVKVHFSGHMHVQNIKKEENIAEIITSSLAISPNQYGKITIENQKLSYEVKQVNVSEWAVKEKSQNPNLLNFSAYAKQFFFDTNLNALLEGVDREEEKTMIQFFVDVNYAYYCGKMDWSVLRDCADNDKNRIGDVNYSDVTYDDRNIDNTEELGKNKKYEKEKLLALWRERDDFIAEYLESILREMEEEHCKFAKHL